MKIAQLLAQDRGGSTSIRAAIGRAEEAGREAAGRLEELLADDERSLDRLEALLTKTQRDADRADLAIVELTRRLGETEAAERRSALDATHGRGLAAQQKAVTLITRNYTRLAGQMRDLMLELKGLDAEVESVNAELERAGDERRVQEPDSIARPDNGIVRVGCVAVWRAVCLPSPTIQSEHLYPATDRWGQPLERAA
jgi:chromosome segregation ATPase